MPSIGTIFVQPKVTSCLFGVMEKKDEDNKS